MSETEIEKELKDRKMILDYMVKNDIRSLDEVGKVLHTYYLDKQALLNAVKSNMPKQKLLEM